MQSAHQTSRASRRRLVLAVAGLLAGCLPAGNPPPGQHIVHDRALSGVYFTASEVDGVPSRLLATGPFRLPSKQCAFDDTDLLADVFYFPAPEGQAGAVSLSRLQPTIKDFILQGGDVAKYNFATDRRGRPVYLACSPPPTGTGVPTAWSYDWAAEGARYVGIAGERDGKIAFLLSPGRTRILGYSLIELDGSRTDLGSVDQGAFVGEDFYYVLPQDWSIGDRINLGRSKPGAVPELLLSSTESIGLAAIEGDRTPQILVCMYSASGLPWGSPCGNGYAPFALLDTQKLTTSVLPFRPVQLAFDSASSNGHWLLFTSPDADVRDGQAYAVEFLFFDWTAGATARVSPSFFGGLPINGATEWRPGHEELWFYFYQVDTNFGTWDPASGPRLRAGIPATMTAWSDGRTSMFTREGNYWLSWGNAQRTVYLGPADDPAAPTFPIHPDGTVITALWETGDGRLLVGSSTTDPDRQDIAVVDPALRTTRTIASGGHLVALGHTRALAVVNWESTRAAGDLALIDLASGAQTILAENVYAAAVDPGTTADVPPEKDRLAPGTRVAFLTRSRLESPYDGLWVASLP